MYFLPICTYLYRYIIQACFLLMMGEAFLFLAERKKKNLFYMEKECVFHLPKKRQKPPPTIIVMQFFPLSSKKRLFLTMKVEKKTFFPSSKGSSFNSRLNQTFLPVSSLEEEEEEEEEGSVLICRIRILKISRNCHILYPRGGSKIQDYFFVKKRG